MIIPHVQLNHRVASGIDPLEGGTECLPKALVLLRCDTNGTRH